MTEPPSVLIVDDNRDAADLLGEALRTLGYRVRVAHTSREALAALDEAAFDTALLDIGLPELDGYELAREAHRKDADLALIAITGYGQSSDRMRAFEAGFAEHLVKPVTLADVTIAIEAHVRRR